MLLKTDQHSLQLLYGVVLLITASCRGLRLRALKASPGAFLSAAEPKELKLWVLTDVLWLLIQIRTKHRHMICTINEWLGSQFSIK